MRRTYLLLTTLVALAAFAVQGLPPAQAAGPVTVSIDANTAVAGVQATATVGSPLSIAVLIGNASDVQAFNFEVVYDQTALTSPTISTGSDLDRNPDANQAVLQATGRTWACSPPAPTGDKDPSPTVGSAFLSCFSTGVPAGPAMSVAGDVVATVQFTAVHPGASSLTLQNLNVFKAGGTETGSCNPVVVIAATCAGATLTVTSPPSVGGIAEVPDVATLQLDSRSAHATAGRILEIAGALVLIAAVLLIVRWRRRHSIRSA